MSTDHVAAGRVEGARREHLATVRVLFVLSALGIIYGSLYPFDFDFGLMPAYKVEELLFSGWDEQLGTLNLMTNILLFIPYGLFGVLAFASWRWYWAWPALAVITVVVAFGVQVLQLWLPGRVPTFADGIINLGGLAIGAGLAYIPVVRRLLTQRHAYAREIMALPFLLMLCWLAYRLFPFVPSVAISSIKDGLRPILLEPELRPFDVFHNAVAWIVFAHLWERCRLPWLMLWLVIPGVVLAPIGIADNALALHNVIGAAVALVAWWGLRSQVRRPVEVVVLLLMTMLLVQGLRPFEYGPSEFTWLPFQGFLGGSMVINTLSLLEKTFLYGSLVWLILEASQSRATALLLPVILLAAIEAAQTQIATRSAEVTDPVMAALFWAVVMVGWRPERARVGRSGRRRVSGGQSRSSRTASR
ncbi:VanZ family protein [Aquisalimonas asiatica]|uniref:VanZ like family protein n=1 Tax=Aquisalimonas asiatica TaxID=406100 RepID=A0A1H8U5F9_9GAMM|nr:VanZ family protein [Aquisalimonas asiatica]SEO98395.1 VanZ like family protein [Aquisalimonas asiatica]